MDDLGKYIRVGLVAGIPPPDARVIPIVPHPLTVFPYHLLGAPGLPVTPDREFVLKDQPGLVGDIHPEFRNGTDADSEAIPMQSFRQFDQQVARPSMVPRQALRFGIFQETMKGDI